MMFVSPVFLAEWRLLFSETGKGVHLRHIQHTFVQFVRYCNIDLRATAHAADPKLEA